MITQTAIARSERHNPYDNLAYEEWLLNNVGAGEIILYLWQNERTVVVGKNQDAFAEADVAKLEADGGFLARRVSGGGAVYHDLGNVNFTFITRNEDHDIPRQTGVVLAAVNRLAGGQAERTGRNDLTIGGRKFSGHAWYKGAQSAFHHGTILLDTDFSRMSAYLYGGKQVSKGVPSVAARVVNLTEAAPGVTVEDVMGEMARAFASEYGAGAGSRGLAADLPGLAALRDKYASAEWRYGLSGKAAPPDITRSARFDWGGVTLALWLGADGLVARAAAYSDAMDVRAVAELPGLAVGKRPEEIGLAQLGEWACMTSS